MRKKNAARLSVALTCGSLYSCFCSSNSITVSLARFKIPVAVLLLIFLTLGRGPPSVQVVLLSLLFASLASKLKNETNANDHKNVEAVGNVSVWPPECDCWRERLRRALHMRCAAARYQLNERSGVTTHAPF